MQGAEIAGFLDDQSFNPVKIHFDWDRIATLMISAHIGIDRVHDDR